MALPPLPKPYQDTAPYWDAAKEHKFVIQQCDDCGKFQFYPRGICSHCHSSNLSWRDSEGKGTIYSFTVSERAPHPGFKDRLPFILAMIDLAEGPRMMSNLIDCDPDTLKIGMPVKVVFDDITEEITLPKFTPA